MKTNNISFILFLLVLAACSSEQDPAPMQQDVCDKITLTGKTACIPFSGSVDEKISGKIGTAVGAVLTTDRKGNNNSAYSFDGVDDYIQIDNPPIDINGNFTVVIWAMIDNNFPVTGKIRFMDSRINSFNPNNSLNIYLDVNTHLLTVAGIGTAQFELDLEIGTWFQLAVVYDETEREVEAFINGVTLPELDQTFEGYNYSAQPLIIGARSDLKEFFPGKIDDISFYNRDLKTSEITSLLLQ